MKLKYLSISKFLLKSLVMSLLVFIGTLLSGIYTGGLADFPSIWLPGGICLALIFFWGFQFIPVTFLSLLFSFLILRQPIQPSLLLTTANTLEIFLAVYFLKNVFHIKSTLVYLKDVLKLVAVTLVLSISFAAIKTLICYAYGYINGTYYPSWIFLWISDLMGCIIISPLIMVWFSKLPEQLRSIQKRLDWIVIAVALFVTATIFLQGEKELSYFGSLTYIIFLFLFWIALRLFQRGTTMANLGIIAIAITLMQYNGMGISLSSAFAMAIMNIFLIATVITSLIMAALFSEREIAIGELKDLNIDLENKVSQRTQELRSVNAQLKKELKSRKEIESELRVSEDNLRTIIENFPDAMIQVNTQGEIIDINNHMMSLFNINRSDYKHIRLSDFSDPDLNPEDLQEYFNHAVTGEAVKFEWKARRPFDNSVFPVEIELKRIWLDKEPIIIGSIRDLTDRIKMIEAEHEQRELAEALQNTAAALSSVHGLDDVFDNILKNVGNVVPHDAVNLMLIEDGIAHIVHSHGYKKLGMLDYIHNVIFDVDKVPNLHFMVETGKPIIISDVNKDPEWIVDERAKCIQSYAGAPIRVKGGVIGFIQLDSGTPGFFRKEHSERLQAFADQAAVAIENARLYTELQKLAITDSLTNLYNRHGFNPPASREFEIARRYGRNISAILFDIDHLKIINDAFGHPVGDRALKMIAACCQSTLREIDLVARFGGDEFVIILSETGLVAGLEVAARLKQCIREHLFEVDGKVVDVTISAGVAELKKGMKSLDDLIDTADRGSYLAKSQGRDSIATIQSIPRKTRIVRKG